MMAFLYALLFFIGICVGSFLNAFEYRLFRGLDFVKDRSKCPKCGHVLGLLDLIPILSFFLIKGRCRYCGTCVSWQYPIIELATGIAFTLAGWYVSTKMHILGISDVCNYVFFAFLVGLLFSLFVFFALYDVKHKIVSNKVVVPAIVFGLFLNILFAVGVHFSPFFANFGIILDENVSRNILAGLFGGLFIAFLIIVTKGKGMGGGDLKLMVFMGLILGYKRLIISLYFAVFSASIIGILWGLKKGKIVGTKIPFALFLSVGSIFAFIWGEMLWGAFFTRI